MSELLPDGGACDPWEGLTDEEREAEIAKLKGEGMSDQTEGLRTFMRREFQRMALAQKTEEVFAIEEAMTNYVCQQLEAAKAREEALRSVAEQVDVAMDGAAIYGVKSVLAPPYWRQWVEAHKALRDYLNPSRVASEPPAEEGT